MFFFKKDERRNSDLPDISTKADHVDSGGTSNQFTIRTLSENTDWEAVNTIEDRYRSSLFDLEERRKVLQEELENVRPPEHGDRDTRVKKYYDEKIRRRRELLIAENNVRDKERELWNDLSKVMTYPDLTRYKLNHSMDGKKIMEETEWFEPNDDEIMVLYTANEMLIDFIDENFNRDVIEWEKKSLIGHNIKHELMRQGMSIEQITRALGSLEGDDLDAVKAADAFDSHLQYIRERFSSKRHREYNLGGMDPEITSLLESDMEYSNQKELYLDGKMSASEFYEYVDDIIISDMETDN